MLKKLFAVFGATAAERATSAEPNPAEDALLRQIAERSKSDPLIGAKIGSKDVTQRLINGMKTDRGVHIESLLCALGAVAGYACQASVRAIAVSRKLPEDALLTKAQTKDGTTFFFGDNLNKPLAESQYSVWSVAGGGAQQAGCASLPDLGDMFKHTASVVGSREFGIPRVPNAHAAHDTPINYVRSLWPALHPLAAKYCADPMHWPVLFALSIQDVIVMGKSVLNPCVALTIVMESAIPMSKVNLDAT